MDRTRHYGHQWLLGSVPGSRCARLHATHRQSQHWLCWSACWNSHEHHRVHVASCKGIPKPVQQEVGLQLPSCTLLVRGEAQGRANWRVHDVASPRRHNRLFPPTVHLVPPFRNPAPRNILSVNSYPLRRLPPQTMHMRAAANHSCPRLFSGVFPRPPNTTDVPTARITCCTNCHIAHISIVVPRVDV